MTALATSLPSAIHDALTALDDRLVEVLAAGDIRLVRSSWLIDQPDGFRMGRRQALEALDVSPSPLLEPAEAAALVRTGSRGAGALTYGWPSRANPDPTGQRVDVLRRTLAENSHIVGFFWDWASLYQLPRTLAQEDAFRNALGCMGDLYASAIGTTVLQLKDIPPRPPEFDGKICLFDLKDGADEAAIREALKCFGAIESIDVRDLIVRFEKHDAARAARREAAKLTHICGGIDTLYNERSYDGRTDEEGLDDDHGRGWCVFESSASGELIIRLSAVPNIKAALDSLPPKLLALSSSAPPEEVKMQASKLDTRVEEVERRIQSATFTGRGDKPMVVDLYKHYVGRIASSLQRALAFVTAGDDQQQQLQPDLPHWLVATSLQNVTAPPAAPLRLAAGQMLIVLPSSHGTGHASGEGDVARFGVVDASERRVELTGAGSDVELTFDGCSQTVLPWRPPAEGWDAALLSDAELLRAMDSVRTAGDAAKDIIVKSSTEATVQRVSETALQALAAVQEAAQTLALREAVQVAALLIESAAAEAVAAVNYKVEVEAEYAAAKAASLGNPARGLFGSSANALKKAEEKAAEGAADAAQSVRALCNAITQKTDWLLTAENQDSLLLKELRATSAVGARCYAAGQALTVHAAGMWMDAEVEAAEGGTQHRLRLPYRADALSLELHPWNHAPRELSVAAFEALREAWTKSLRAQHTHIIDVLSGSQLDTMEQCVAIKVTGTGKKADSKDVNDVRDLRRLMHTAVPRDGQVTADPCAVLLTAPPAAGKTTLMSQMVVLTLKDSSLVPIIIKVQHLQRRLLESPDAFASVWNWLDAYLRLENEPALYRFLRQAMMARRALLLLDGLDEGGQMREAIERHVAEVLAPQGHPLLVTSRSAGIAEARYAGFRRLALAPLTDAQQRQALTQRLGSAAAAELLAYVDERMPLNTETKDRITANPLMLSMMASVFELRRGVAMPSTVVELYATASDAMLSRGGAATPELRKLLERIFFEAHVTQRRVIKDQQLHEAAIGLEAPESLAFMRFQANLPFLGEMLSESAKSQALNSMSANTSYVLDTVRERVAKDSLPLLSLLQVDPLIVQSSHLSFQEYFAAKALCEGPHLAGEPPWRWPAWWANALTIGAEMGAPFARGLKRAARIESDALDLSGKVTKHGADRPTALRAVAQLMAVLTSINLSDNEITGSEAELLAEGIQSGTCSLTALDLSDNPIGAEGVQAMTNALVVNKESKIATLRFSQSDGSLPFTVPVGELRNGTKEARAALLREMVPFTRSGVWPLARIGPSPLHIRMMGGLLHDQAADLSKAAQFVKRCQLNLESDGDASMTPETWWAGFASLIANGEASPDTLERLLAATTLKAVRFPVSTFKTLQFPNKAIRDLAFSPAEARLGGYDVCESADDWEHKWEAVRRNPAKLGRKLRYRTNHEMRACRLCGTKYGMSDKP